MGLAAGLFFTTEVDKQTLHRRVKPSDKQYASQMDRWNDLGAFLKRELRNSVGLNISTWLQGSYKFGTQVRPHTAGEEFDIDLGVYFEWAGSANNGDYDPIQLKNSVQKALEDYSDDEDNDAEEVSPPKMRCCRIHFGEDFHIDVPAYHLDIDDDIRALATEDDEWEYSDPKAIYVWWRDSVDEALRPRARRLVQYLKMWSALNIESEKRPSSIMLTVLVAEALNSLDQSKLAGDDEWFFSVAEAIYSRLDDDQAVYNPVDGNEDLNRLSQSASNELVDHSRA